jgi:hypothetical protein
VGVGNREWVGSIFCKILRQSESDQPVQVELVTPSCPDSTKKFVSSLGKERNSLILRVAVRTHGKQLHLPWEQKEPQGLKNRILVQ